VLSQPAAAPLISPLRRARLQRNWTLDETIEHLDADSPEPTGITVSMLSGWERGTSRTSLKHRKKLCRLFREPPEVLFAHQDGTGQWSPAVVEGDHDPTLGLSTPAVVVHTVDDLRAAMLDIVASAEQDLAVCGSRSRDLDYLSAIEQTLRARPRLVHWRVLCGPPRKRFLLDHLLQLLELRNPKDRTYGVQTLNIAMVELGAEPERGVVANEHRALVAVPSLSGDARNFDSAVLFTAPVQAGRVVEHVRQLYAASAKFETREALLTLPTPPR